MRRRHVPPPPRPRALSEPPGNWSPERWLGYLRQRASGCDEQHKARAAELSEAADELEARLVRAK